MRRLLAVLIAPMATPAALAVAFALLSLWQLVTMADWSPWLAVYGWLMVATVATPAAYLMTAVVGLPLTLRLERRGRTDLGATVALGLVLGVLPFVLFDLYIVAYELANSPTRAIPRLFADAATASKWIALGAMCGVATAWAYWSIGKPRS